MATLNGVLIREICHFCLCTRPLFAIPQNAICTNRPTTSPPEKQPMLDRLGVFISCAIPSLLFYILTRQPDAKPSNVILSAIVLLQLVIPLAFNGGGEMLDMAVIAFFSCYASFGMVRYMADDNEHVEPFYKVLGRWNDRKKEGERHPQVRHNKEVSAIRKDAIGWLSHALLIVIISVPVMAFLDGFLRMCIEPLEIPYMTLLLTAPHHIPLKTLIYYTIAGTAFLMHVVFVPSFIQLGYSIELLIRSVMGSQYTLRKRYDVVHTYVHSPPLFDRPWLSTSIHELWSRYSSKNIILSMTEFFFFP